jgi:carbonic anhydrase
MKKLVRGIIDFRNRIRPDYRDTFARLALGQSPDALLIACSDSRVVPNLFASTEPGDLFVTRNVGNLVPPATDRAEAASHSEAAALEFAVLSLNIRDIIICGHSDCGAMRAALEHRPTETAPHLHGWLRHVEPVLRQLTNSKLPRIGLEPHNHLSQLNVLQQIEHLRTYPFIRTRETDGTLRLHGWWFDIADAEVYAYEPDQLRFVLIDEAVAARILARLDAEHP